MQYQGEEFEGALSAVGCSRKREVGGFKLYPNVLLFEDEDDEDEDDEGGGRR